MASSTLFVLALLAVAFVCVSAQVPSINGIYIRPNWYGNCDASVNVTSTPGAISAAFTNGKLNGTTWWSQNKTGSFYNYFERNTLLPCGSVPVNVTLFTTGIIQLNIAPYTGRCTAVPKATAYFLVQSNPCNFDAKMVKHAAGEIPEAM